MSFRPVEITEARLHRRVVPYQRQSTPEQVRENIGSTGLQRDLVPMLEEWGYRRDRIEEVDEDYGVSGAMPGRRHGFNRLIEMMKTGAIGLVAVTNTSRLSRNVIEFAQFAAIARLHDVLLWHAGQIVDFRLPSSEFFGLFHGLNDSRENRERADNLRRAKRRKAEAGRASTRPPVGYVTTDPGAWEKDPNPAVRNAIQLIFDTFFEIKTAAGVARWFRSAGILVPGRRSRRSQPWSRATHCAVLDILRNEVYSGTYVYGKTAIVEVPDPQFVSRRKQVNRPITTWIRNEQHHEGYVTPQQWEEIQRRLTANRNPARPTIGRGAALLQGVLRCSIHRMTFRTFYPNKERRPNGAVVRLACYRCDGIEHGEITCCSQILAAKPDKEVETALLKRLAPPSITALRDAAQKALRTHEAVGRQREDELRRANQIVADAERVFNQISPSHPLVRARLAEKLEQALKEREAVKERHLLSPLRPPMTLDDAEIAELQELVQRLPALWQNPTLTPVQKKEVIRTAINTINVTPGLLEWSLDIQWAVGGATTVTVLTQRGERAIGTSRKGSGPPSLPKTYGSMSFDGQTS